MTSSLTDREDLQIKSGSPSTRLTVADLEQLQGILCEAHLDYQLELVDGKIIIMGPSDIVSREIGAELVRLLLNWVVTAHRNCVAVLQVVGFEPT